MGGPSFRKLGRSFIKKKDLNEKPTQQDRAKLYRSVLGADPIGQENQNRFSAPLNFGPSPIPDHFEDEEMNLQNASAWDLAMRYHEFKSRRSFQGALKRLRVLSASAILERAQKVLGSIVRPVEQRSSSIAELPEDAQQADLDIEETLENSPLGLSSQVDYPLADHDIWMNFLVHRHHPIILSVDTSLSMTGEKLALTAVALAVVLLAFPEDLIGIVAFENEAKVLKFPDERISIQLLVERFLDVPAQGYTHLEDGMRGALKLVSEVRFRGQGRPPSAVLLTDGKYTAGKDPAYLASRFPHLVVLKMGRERASLELCRELAHRGKGVLREVDELEALPKVMYGVVKDLLRGRSIT